MSDLIIESGKPIPSRHRKRTAALSELGVILRQLSVMQSVDIPKTRYSYAQLNNAVRYARDATDLKFTVRHLADSDPDTYRIWRTK